MITGKIYLQKYIQDQNNFFELNDLSGIYALGQVTNPYASYFEGYRYTGLYIPTFSSSEMFMYPINIGQRTLTAAPAINIGRGNTVFSPELIRFSGDNGEIVLGEFNNLISGVSNTTIGHNNASYRNFGGYIYGIDNTTRNSFYNLTIGSANYISGIYASNVFGKGNVVFADYGNNVDNNAELDPKNIFTFSGYSSLNTSIFGDNNFLFSGGVNVTSLGQYNSLQGVSFLTNVGSLNHVHRTSGDNNLVVGNRNDSNQSLNVNIIGLENELSFTNNDFIVGSHNLNEISYGNFVFGQFNRNYNAVENFIVGNTNTSRGSLDVIIGTENTTRSGTLNNLILGKLNTISGSENNLLIGKSNSIDQNLILDFGISLYKGDVLPFNLLNFSKSYGPDYDPTARFESNPYYLSGIDTTSYDNVFLGNSNKVYFTNSSYMLGESNKLLSNFDLNLIGNSNTLINNSSAAILGSDNFISGTNKNYIFGFNNSIKNNTTGVFVGFNFASGNGTISGVGIKITPNGIDIYGPLRVNGTQLNIP